MAKILGPAYLVLSKDLRSRKVLQVLVVHDNIDQKGSAFEIMMPMCEGVEDCQEFLIVRIVVEFGRLQRLGPKHNRVDFAVITDDG
jgi:hypothetical protein